MEKASAQAERAGKIIRRMREFVKKSEPVRSPVALAEIVEEAIGFADIEARKASVASASTCRRSCRRCSPTAS
jgi:phosphoglycerate-specific signal transduction histidine kinase